MQRKKGEGRREKPYHYFDGYLMSRNIPIHKIYEWRVYN